MAVICISDIHGHLDELKMMIDNIINFKRDTLILCGDYVDFGPKPMETMLYIRELKNKNPDNVIVLIGNHDLMFLEAIKQGKTLGEVRNSTWGYNNGADTYKRYMKLTPLKKLMIQDVFNFMQDQIEIKTNKRQFIIAHASAYMREFEGLAAFELSKQERYKDKLDYIVWNRTYPFDNESFGVDKYKDFYFVHGHTITKKFIEEYGISELNKCVAMISSARQIHIDCGAKVIGYRDYGRLAAVDLTHLKVKYSDEVRAGDTEWKPLYKMVLKEYR